MLAMVSVAVAMGYNVNKQELRPEECTAQPGGKTTVTTLLLGIKIATSPKCNQHWYICIHTLLTANILLG